MDCCHSGTILDLKYQYMDVDKVNPKNLETAGKVYMISGCMDRQTSADVMIHKQAQGAMTWSLLNTLKPNITWRELLQSMRTLLKVKWIYPNSATLYRNAGRYEFYCLFIVRVLRLRFFLVPEHSGS